MRHCQASETRCGMKKYTYIVSSMAFVNAGSTSMQSDRPNDHQRRKLLHGKTMQHRVLRPCLLTVPQKCRRWQAVWQNWYIPMQALQVVNQSVIQHMLLLAVYTDLQYHLLSRRLHKYHILHASCSPLWCILLVMVHTGD